MPGRLGLEPSNVGVCFIIRSYANTTNLQEMNLLPPIIANTLPYTLQHTMVSYLIESTRVVTNISSKRTDFNLSLLFVYLHN